MVACPPLARALNSCHAFPTFALLIRLLFRPPLLSQELPPLSFASLTHVPASLVFPPLDANTRSTARHANMARTKNQPPRPFLCCCMMTFTRRPSPKRAHCVGPGICELGFRSPATCGSHTAHDGHPDLCGCNGCSLDPIAPPLSTAYCVLRTGNILV